MIKPKKPGESESYKRSWIKRQKVLRILGNVCQECGFADPRALQIVPSPGGGSSFLNRILRDAGSYELFCANCVQIKRVQEVPKEWKDAVAKWELLGMPLPSNMAVVEVAEG